MLTATELMTLVEEADTDLDGIDLSWTDSDEIRAYEEEDAVRRRPRNSRGQFDENQRGYKPPTPKAMKWLPKEMGNLVRNSTDPSCLSRGTTRTGIHIIRRILCNAMTHEETICGRLFLLQSEKKKKKSKTGLPSKKTTRPITVSSVIQKILEKILLKRITRTVILNTEVENAGFKPYMSCELQL